MSSTNQGPSALDASREAARLPTMAETGLYRKVVVGLAVLVVMMPVGLIVYQSFLNGAFFFKTSELSLEAFAFVLTDPDFYEALYTTTLVSVGMVAVALPLGIVMSFLLTRTDLCCRGMLEVATLLPMLISSIVLAFGYTVSVGPSGFVSLFVRETLGFVPWDIYSLSGIIVIAGLSHVPHVVLYVSSAMRNLPSELEEAAQTSGAGVGQVLWDVTLPMVLPSILFAAALNLLLGYEMFGIPLVLGDPQGIMVLTTYIYKLTTLFGVPTYQLMAVVTVFLVMITLPLIYVQRRLLRQSKRFVAVGGKGGRQDTLSLGTRGQILALLTIGVWFFAAVLLPIGGIVVRAFVDAWGEGIRLSEHLTLANFEELLEVPRLVRGIVNTLLIGTVGGAVAVGVYLLMGLAWHRNTGWSGAVLDYLVLLPRALPGLVVGLAFFWVFLFVPILRPLRPTLVSLFVAYLVVGLSYGLRLIQANLLQVEAELEEAARTLGATEGRTWRDIVVPLVRPGLAGAWALIMIIFIREYAAGVYLMTSGTEVIGSLMVSLLQTGAMDTIAALAFTSIVLTSAALALAHRLGAPSMTELIVTNVHKWLSELHVLRGCSFTAERASIVALLGASGSGKTTLLRTIAGLGHPERGRIVIGSAAVFDADKKLAVPPEKRSVGLVFQSYALWPHRTVAENVGYSLKVRRVGGRELQKRVESMLRQMGLEQLANRYPHQLSGGQQQRVAICRALIYEPRVLLLDEPLSNLDAKLRAEARDWIRISSARGFTVTTSAVRSGCAASLAERRMPSVKRTPSVKMGAQMPPAELPARRERRASWRAQSEA